MSYKPMQHEFEATLQLYQSQEQAFGTDHRTWNYSTYQSMLAIAQRIREQAVRVMNARIAERARRIQSGYGVDPGHDQAISSASNQAQWADDRIRHLLNEMSLLRSASGNGSNHHHHHHGHGHGHGY